MRIIIKQLKTLIREAVKSDKKTFKNKLISQLEEAYQNIDIANEEDVYNILFEAVDFMLQEFCGIDPASMQTIDVLSEDEIIKLVEDWQTKKTNMLMKNIDQLPEATRTMLEDMF